jgi:hypothetical protein
LPEAAFLNHRKRNAVCCGLWSPDKKRPAGLPEVSVNLLVYTIVTS